jgi:nucleoside-diphosphate-sugar epimerase
LECVRRLCEKSGDEVSEIRAAVRNPSVIAPDFFPKDSRVKILAGDVTDEKGLDEVLKGAQYAIFAAAGGRDRNQEVDELGLKKTFESAERCGLRRVVVCSSQLVDPANRWNMIRLLLNTLVWGTMDSKHRGEQHVRAFCAKARVEYAIVRPGRLVDGPLGGSGGVAFGQTNAHFLRGAGSTRADVARVIVHALTDPAVRNCTFEMAGLGAAPAAAPASPPEASLFAGLQSDEARARPADAPRA